MTKYILFLITIIIVAGCSEDKDSLNEDAKALLIGVWSPRRFVYEQDGEIVHDYQANECQIQSRHIYLEEDILLEYIYSGTVDNCGYVYYYNPYTFNGTTMSILNREALYYVTVTEDSLILEWLPCNFDCDRWNTHYYERVDP